MSTMELVGPVPRVWFVGSAWAAYQPPRDTLDNRYAACRQHRPACDCREATFAEDRAEMSAELGAIKLVIRSALAGHRTFDFDALRGSVGIDGVCLCSGCVIVRALDRQCIQTRSYTDQYRETADGAS